MSKTETLKQISEDVWRLERRNESGECTDIIEGPLIFIINDFLLRGTGLRIYKDRRKRYKK